MRHVFRICGGLVVNFIALLLLAFLFVASVQAETVCKWHPGAAPYKGDTVKALDDYPWIGPTTKMRLGARLKVRDYDTVVRVYKDRIEDEFGHLLFRNTITHMHYKGGKVCDVVDRSDWAPDHFERAFAYTDGLTVVFVPFDCDNVALGDLAEHHAEAPPAVIEEFAGGEASGGTVIILAPVVIPAAVTFEDRVTPPVVTEVVWAPSAPTYIEMTDFIVNQITVNKTTILPPVTPVPEPETWALMLAGLVIGGAKWRMRRR